MDVSSSPHSHSRLRQERMRHNYRQQDVADYVGTTVTTVRRWERGNQQPGPYYRARLCELFGKSASELGLVPDNHHQAQEVGGEMAIGDQHLLVSPSPEQVGIWGIPYPRNPFFTGREEFLHTLHERLNQEGRLALSQSWAISGLGGIGKTQIALEYAYQYHQDYHAIFWTSAVSREALLAGFTNIAELLQLPAKDEPDQNKVFNAVKHWLATHQNWLLILDNADNVKVVQDIALPERSGHLLLTTRAQALGTLAQRLEVETMGLAEGTLFLLRRAKLLSPDASLDQAREAHLASAEAIVIAMDFLPLALDQAGAYIEEVGCSLASYLALYRTYRQDLLRRRGHVPGSHPEPVAATWSLNFQHIEQINLAAADLLRLCAFLEPDAIPEELICEGSAFLPAALQQAASNELMLNDAIEKLRTFSLIQRDPESRLLRVHRLVQAVQRDAMEIEEQHQWAERAVRATNALFPGTVEPAMWARCQRYLPQAQACSALIQDYTLTFVEAASLLFRTANYLRMHALYEQAELLYQRALQIREEVLGPGHPEVARAFNSLAIVYDLRGQYAEAEQLYLRASRINEQALGSEHPEVVRPLNNLANLYQKQARYAEAEQLYQRALGSREKALGPEHPEVASTLNNLATLYTAQGKYAEAESFHQRALEIREKVLGPEHPGVAQSLDNLANLYCDQGRYAEAEPLCQRAARIRERVWGAEHPDIAVSLSNLADLYVLQKKYAEAEPLYQRAVSIKERAFGSEHYEVAFPLNGLANLYRHQGKYEQAEMLFQRCLHIREQVSGQQHLDTADTLHDFAALREAQSNYQQAASLYQRALAIYEQLYHQDHPRTVETRDHLHAVLHILG